MKVMIIGLGLIGGSLARALKQLNSIEIMAYDKDQDSLHEAQQLGVIDYCCKNITDNIENTDIIIIAVTLGQTQQVLQAIAPALTSRVVITDVGSVKQTVITDAKLVLGNHFSQFVPGHPIAGSEKSGFQASLLHLFHQKPVILTPTDDTNPHAIEKITQLWQSIDALVSQLPADIHDNYLGFTSHLPHLLAFGFIQMIAEHKHADELLRFTGGGFRDFTRIAGSDAGLWRDIFMGNKTQLLACINSFKQHFSTLEQLLITGNNEQLLAYLQAASTQREKLSPVDNH